MKPRLFLDVDGVLADFIAGACSVWGHHPREVVTWNFFDAWGLTPAQFWGPLGRQFWAGLPKTPEADSVVAYCEDTFGQENVCLLTSPCDTDGCCEGKLEWIGRHYPQYRHRFLLGQAKGFCSYPGALLVDDSDSNCEKFCGAGGRAFLFPRPWNKSAGVPALSALREWLSWVSLPRSRHGCGGCSPGHCLGHEDCIDTTAHITEGPVS